MTVQQEWIDDVRRWCFEGGRADSPLLASALDAVDSDALLATLPQFSQAAAATRTVVTQKFENARSVT